MVEENSRQLCVFQETAPDHKVWWSYVNAFSSDARWAAIPCALFAWILVPAKTTRTNIRHHEAGCVDPNRVKHCVKTSGGTSADQPNTLDAQIQAQIDQDAFMTIIVQGAVPR